MQRKTRTTVNRADSLSEDDSDNMMVTPNDSPVASPIANTNKRYRTDDYFDEPNEEVKINGEVNANTLQ